MWQSGPSRRGGYWGNFSENLILGSLKREIWCIFCVQYHTDFYISNFLYIFFALGLQIYLDTLEVVTYGRKFMLSLLVV